MIYVAIMNDKLLLELLETVGKRQLIPLHILSIQKTIFQADCDIKLRNGLEPIYTALTEQNPVIAHLEPHFKRLIAGGFEKDLAQIFGVGRNLVPKQNGIAKSIPKTSLAVPRKSIPKAVRDRLWITTFGADKAKGSCQCCGKEIHILDWEAGHVIAAAKGGPDTIENLRPICGVCNRSMGTQNLEEFRKNYFG